MAAAEATGDDTFMEAQTPLLNGVVFVEGSVDFNGRPAVRSKSGCWKSSFYILGAETAERFAIFGIRSNLISYLIGPMGQSTALAVVNVNLWTGTAELLPLVGAFVGDAYLGRYRTVVIASLFYILGLGSLSLSAALRSSNCKNVANNMTCSPSIFNDIFFFCCLYLVALMQGGHRPCLQAFGADQFDDSDENERKAKSSFFNWWNFSFSVGRLVAFSVLSYVQDNLSWELGFGIQSFVVLFALIVFSLGTGSYRFRVDDNAQNPFAKIGSVFVKAVRNWQATPAEEANQTMRCEDTQFRDNETDIEDAKAIFKLVPLWFSCLGFAIVSAQPSTLFTKQGATMERYVNTSFQIPPASLQSLLTIAMIVLLPIYDLIFVPIARATSKSSIGITVLQRTGTGVFLSIISMIIAGLVERKRLATAFEYGLVDMPTATIPMSIWWLVPQYLILGISHCFGLVGLQEFFYDEVPSELKSMGVALYISIFGIGNLASSFLVSVIEQATGGDGKESWFSDNLNRAHLDYFYWVLSGLGSVAFAVYVYFARSYVYTRKTH